MRTAFYTVVLGAALLLTGFRTRQSRRKGCSPRTGIAPVDLKFPLRGRQARRRARSRLFPVPCERPLCGLLDQFCRRPSGPRRMRRGHSALLPHRHVRQRRRLHETASWRGQRDLQGGDGVHGLTRRRLQHPAETAAAQSLDGGRWSRRFKRSSADFHGLHFDSPGAAMRPELKSTGGSGLLEGSHSFT